MLRIYTEILAVIPQLVPVLTAIEQKDSDLGRQGRRALTSVPLNTAEASYSRGRNRAARYHTAAGSAREVVSVLETARAFGYSQPVDDALMNQLFKIVATLFKHT